MRTPHFVAIQLAFGPMYETEDEIHPSIWLTYMAAERAGKLTVEKCPTAGDMAMALLQHRMEELA